MKRNLFFLAFMAMVSALALTSCSDDDDDKTTVTDNSQATFEELTSLLNADGYWVGDTLGNNTYDNWGSKAYRNCIAVNGWQLECDYTPAWGSWSGYALSNRTATSFSMDTYTIDQFNNVTGHGAKGSKVFCVVFPYGEAITTTDGKPKAITGLWMTNTAYTANAIVNGDGMSTDDDGTYTGDKGFGTNDYLYVTITGTHADSTATSVRVYLAQNGDYLKDWQWVDLTSLGEVTALNFAFTTTKKNAYGATTPAYCAIDGINDAPANGAKAGW